MKYNFTLKKERKEGNKGRLQETQVPLAVREQS